MNFGKDIEYGGFPTSETRTIAEMRRDANTYAGIGIKKKYADTKKGVDTTHGLKVECSHVGNIVNPKPTDNRRPQMTLTFKSLTKSGRDAIYTGAVRAVRFSLDLFTDKQAPAAIEVEGNFAAPKAPKVRMTKEERKALRDSQPKPTEAERIARAEAKLAERKAKLAAVAAQPSI